LPTRIRFFSTPGERRGYRPGSIAVSTRSLLVSSSNRARIRRARAWLLGQVGTSDKEVLVVGPTRRAADDFVRDSCPLGKGLIGIQRATLMQLASEIASPLLVDKTAAPLGALGSLALTTRAIHLALRDGPLAYFEPVARMPGFARALSATILELRLEEIGMADLSSKGGTAAGDLARLKAAFESELDRACLKDARDVLSLAAEAASEGGHRFARMPVLFLDLSLATKTEAALVRALAERAPETLATSLLGDEIGTRALEDALDVEAAGIEDEDGGLDRSDALSRARRFVFSRDEPISAASDASLEFFSAPGEGREATEIARRIIGAASEGVRFDRMAIFLRDPDRYQPLVEESLRRAHIPAFFTSGTVRPDPSGRALLALIACAREDLSAVRFAEYLSLGQVPVPDEDGAPKKRDVPWAAPKDETQLVFKTAMPEPTEADADDGTTGAPEPEEDPDAPVVAGSLRAPFGWEKLIVEASVIGKKERWTTRLAGLAKELEAQMEEAPEDLERLNAQRERLQHLAAFALPIIDYLADLPETAIWKVWLDRLLVLAGMALRKTNTIAAVLSELRPMEEVGPVSLEEVREVLLDRLTFLRAEPPNRRYGKVFVASLEEAAGREFEIVFVPGLAEGIFPKKKHEDPLLLDSVRRTLADHLKIQARRSAEERVRLMLALGSAGRKVIASYPRMDVGEGRSRVPSFYALDLLRAAEGRLPHLRALEKRAEEAAGARLGWPAPRLAEEAIDDAEYDLAILEELIERPEESAKGAARYMILENDCLARSLYARAARWRKRFDANDCFFAKDPASKAELQKARLGETSYAATDLEQFATCPYKFFLGSILRLRPRERAVPLEELDPRTKGRLFHRIQEVLFAVLRDAGLHPICGETVERALDRLPDVADGVAREYEEKLAPAIPRVYWREIEALKKDLRGFLRHTAKTEASWRALEAERTFGEKDPLCILDTFRIKGRIDLVEEHVREGTVRVTDYKTGKRPEAPLRHVGQGERLQPLLYALAAEKMFDRPVASGRLYFATAREEYDVLEIRLEEDSREAIALVLHLIDDSIARGFLPAAPRKSACEQCDFRPVCGPLEERRILQKDDGALGPLVRLRSLP
jgi:CRISPR/Cas system-associated exonuclease Cas4 (RecB family)